MLPHSKPPRHNTPERNFEILAQCLGWSTVTKRGWPDFLAFTPDGSMIAVEVKPLTKDGSRYQILKREQAAVMDVLSSHGIKCYVSDGETMEPYDRERHAPEHRRYSRHRKAKD